MTEESWVDFDVLIVGSGPAGVSAAFPLVDAGLRVLMVDGGHDAQMVMPAGSFLEARHRQADQWGWMVGRDFHALRQVDAVSPKLRVPTHAGVFKDFELANQIVAHDFVAVGSLAPGGLSNAWGCGVACLTDEELAAYPVTPSEMRTSYRTVAMRMGVSGGRADDLSDFFGLDDWSQEPVSIDKLQGDMLTRYSVCREKLHRNGFRLGRSRVAALTKPMANRQACDRCGSCLWGCKRGALYSATADLQLLKGRPGFSYRSGFVVERVLAQDGVVAVEGKERDGHAGVIRARRVLLAAGTLASTRLALQAIQRREPVSMQSCPTAAFMLWLPRYLGRAHEDTFGLGQLSFSLNLAKDTLAFGSLFSTTGIPVTEFAHHLPFGKRYGLDILESLLTSCVVGNLFLPGAMTDASLRVDADNSLVIRGMYRDEVPDLMREARQRLAASFRRLGAILMPASFKMGRPGSDIHYAASLPMRAKPVRGQTDCYGELVGAAGIHVVDGASLPSLPAKSHTLTIMANADRIARHLAQTLP